MYTSTSDSQGHDIVAQQEPSDDVEATISNEIVSTNIRPSLATHNHFSPVSDSDNHRDDDTCSADHISHSSTLSLLDSIRDEPRSRTKTPWYSWYFVLYLTCYSMATLSLSLL